MIWTSDYLNILATEAEIQIAEELKCIYDRLSLHIVQGSAEYQIPEYVSNIIKITWRGVRLDPVPQIEYPDWMWTLETDVEGAFEFEAFTDAYHIGDIIGSTPQGRPERYFYSTFGENRLVFHPTPNESITQLSGDLWNSNLQDGIVIEFYRTPNGEEFILPQYIRRRTIKAYVLWKAFAQEGDGQNLKASQYWLSKYGILLNRAKSIIQRINQAQIRSRSDAQMHQHQARKPLLPWNWQTVKVPDYE